MSPMTSPDPAATLEITVPTKTNNAFDTAEHDPFRLDVEQLTPTPKLLDAHYPPNTRLCTVPVAVLSDFERNPNASVASPSGTVTTSVSTHANPERTLRPRTQTPDRSRRDFGRTRPMDQRYHACGQPVFTGCILNTHKAVFGRGKVKPSRIFSTGIIN